MSGSPTSLLTHNFDILSTTVFLKGYSLVEAAHMAIPAHSWQSVVIGDPLYRPFQVLNQDPVPNAEQDKDFRAFQLAVEKWSGEDGDLRHQTYAPPPRAWGQECSL